MHPTKEKPYKLKVFTSRSDRNMQCIQVPGAITMNGADADEVLGKLFAFLELNGCQPITIISKNTIVCNFQTGIQFNSSRYRLLVVLLFQHLWNIKHVDAEDKYDIPDIGIKYDNIHSLRYDEDKRSLSIEVNMPKDGKASQKLKIVIHQRGTIEYKGGNAPDRIFEVHDFIMEFLQAVHDHHQLFRYIIQPSDIPALL